MGLRTPIVSAAVALHLLAAPAAVANQPQSASAAATLPPQVLGLVALATPIPLSCDGGECVALVSSFCLQEDRPPPADGQSYVTAGAGDVTLVVTEADGTVREFAAAGLLTYASDGHFTRTRVTLDQSRLASLNASSVAVRIAPMVSLIPMMSSPVPAAVAERDSDTALGAPRFAAEGFFAPGAPRSDAAVTLTRMINALPPTLSGGVDPTAIDPFKRAALWDHVTVSGGTTGLSVEGVERAKGELDRCGQFAEMGYKLSLRGCLESAHDRTMREVNDEFWDADVGY